MGHLDIQFAFHGFKRGTDEEGVLSFLRKTRALQPTIGTYPIISRSARSA